MISPHLLRKLPDNCWIVELVLILTFAAPPLSAHVDVLFDEEFISRKSFVDKSEFLAEFFRDVSRDFLTAPALYGKTSNLKMIEKFAQYQWNVNGDPIHWRETHAYQVFKHLNIAKYESVVSEHMAQHPVILLDLNVENAGVGVFEHLVTKMTSQLSHCFLEHQHKFESYYSSPEVRSEIKNWVLKMLRSPDSWRRDLITNLQYTVEAMNECFDADVVLLIDGFDDFMYRDCEPIDGMLVMYKMVHSMLQNVFHSSAGANVHVFISSISSLVFDHFQMYRNLQLHNFQKGSKYTSYFGIDRRELNDIFNRYESNVTERHHVLKYLGGYTIKGVEYFSPHSISEFFRKRYFSKPRVPYKAFVRPRNPCKFIWKFLKHPKYLSVVARVLKHCPVKNLFKTKYEPRAFPLYIDYVSRNFNCSESLEVGLMFTLSVEHGIFAPVADNTYVVANYLVYTLLLRHLRLHYKLFYRIDIVKIGSYLSDILHSTDELEAKTNLQDYLSESMAKLETDLHEDEASMEFIYHSLLHTATYTNETLFAVEDYPPPVVSDDPASRRRVSLIRRRDTNTALLIKITHRKSAEIALQQASSYVYHERGVDVVKYVGIDVGWRGVVSILVGYVDEVKENEIKKYARAVGR